jgi:signal transduction histidine kinase
LVERFLIGSLSGIVVLTFLYLRRVGAGSGASRWAAAWLVLWLAGLLLSVKALPFQVLGHSLGGCFTPLILAGAYGFVGRPFPRWVAGAAGASIALQAALHAAGLGAGAFSLAAAGDLAMGLAAAHVLWRAGRRGVPLAERLLGPALAALSLLNLADSITRIRGEETLLLVIAWIVLGLTLALVQIMAIVDRVLAREAGEQLTLRAVLETAPVGVFLVDREWRNTVMNRLGAHHFGLGDPAVWLGRPTRDAVRAYLPTVRDPEALIDMMRRVEDEPGLVVEGFEFTLEQPDARTLNVFSSPVVGETGQPMGRIFVTRDVTAERALEEQLRQSQKMETLGTLAGGVAHDFNNQLTAILGNARIALDETPAEGPLRTALLDLERAAEHCAQLTRGLLAFARRAPVRAQAIDVARSVGEVASLLRATLPQGIALRTACDPALRSGLGDPTQLQQILLNLCVNARDAVGERGEIAIEAHDRLLDAAACAGRAGARPGRFVELAVRDDGVGMDARVLGRIFDPFFTTKPLGAGTGLGLAIVYGLVRANQGWIDVESEPGRGTTFRVWLPALDAPPPPPSDAPHGPRAGTERILLAEDEDVVRRVARLALQREGYTVIEARDGAEAVERLRAGERVDLAVLDLSMPRLGGLEALAELRALAPGLPAILTSGHFAEADATADVEFLPKPYRPETLAERVRAVLDGRGEGSSATAG